MLDLTPFAKQVHIPLVHLFTFPLPFFLQLRRLVPGNCPHNVQRPAVQNQTLCQARRGIRSKYRWKFERIGLCLVNAYQHRQYIS